MTESGSAEQQVVSAWLRFSSSESASLISDISTGTSGWSALNSKNLTLFSSFKNNENLKRRCQVNVAGRWRES